MAVLLCSCRQVPLGAILLPVEAGQEARAESGLYLNITAIRS